MCVIKKETVVIRILGENLDFEEIKKNIPLEAHCQKKGTVLYKTHVVENDVIIFEFGDEESLLEDNLRKCIKEIYPYKEYIKLLSKENDTILRIYVQSNMAQMYFYISNDILKKISELSLAVEVSIFSEGMVLEK